MTKFIRCKKCVYPATKPDLFMRDGLCAACWNSKVSHAVDWGAREEQLVELLMNATPSEDGHHCIVPSSGGKDSTYQVLKIIELGFKPLVITAQTCHLTPIGRDNIENLERYADTVIVAGDPDVRKWLNILGMELVGDISWPEHAAIFSVPFREAKARGMDLVVYGECPQREYGGPVDTEEAAQMTARWVSEFGGMLGLRPADFVHMGLSEASMEYYALPPAEDMEKIKAVWLGQFLPWDSHHNAEVAIDAGMKYVTPSVANHWAWENLDNAQTGIHDHMMYRKYGYGRFAGQISVDVRKGKVSRRAALGMVKQFDGRFPHVYAGVTVDEMLTRLGKDMCWLSDHMGAHTAWDLFDGVLDHRPLLKEWSLEEVMAG